MAKIKLTLLFPGITIDGFAGPGQRPKTAWMHHGLCYISASLKSAGVDVDLIDLRRLRGWHELPAALKRSAPDAVGITMMSLDHPSALRAARTVKETLPSAKVIVGGPHASISPDELAGVGEIDHIFKGEAEVTLPRILPGIISGSFKDRIVQGDAPDLDAIPFVDRTLFRTLEAPIVPFLKMPFITAIAGRGCRYNCSFCQPAERLIFGRRVRRMSPGRFVEELELARKNIGMNSLMIHDDCLVEDTDWVETFLKLYRKKGFRQPFVCQARADIIVRHKSLLRDMRRCGLAMLLIGFESGNQRVLNFLRKGSTVGDNLKAASICGRLGIRVWANFMLGIPTETNGEAEDTGEMIKKIRPYVASPAFFTPHPGSDLFGYCRDHGLSLITRHEDYKRDPEGAKIKGADYAYLRKLLASATRVPAVTKIRRKIDRLKLGRFNRDLIKRHEVPEPL